jgi:peptidoglycan/LPS O-acetylase OafA/YrhL
MQNSTSRVECLDGLRGLAALWVLVGHAMILTGWKLPIVGQPDLGVDLFILLSGFLMVFQYQRRRDREDWRAPGTWGIFWARRFFRLAPLFYVMLAAALVMGPMLYADRSAIDLFLGQDVQQEQRYLDSSATNVLLHLTFLFGFSPDYAFRTPLPDWSLGLEMQFYLAFPFLILLVRRVGWTTGALVIAATGVAIAVATMRMGVNFPMPAFLPLKLHLFVCGMLTAAAMDDDRRGVAVRFALVALLAALPIGGSSDLVHMVVREAIVVGFFALIHGRSLAPIAGLSRVLGRKPFFWMGELSYGVYLVHLLILQPVAAWAIARYGTDIGGAPRFALVFPITAVAAYAIAFVTYRAVELPGQALGKRLIARVTGGVGQAKGQGATERLATR